MAAVRRAKRPNATLQPVTKGQVEKTANAIDAKLRPALFPPTAPESIAGTTVPIQTGEVPSAGFAGEGPAISTPGDAPGSSASAPSQLAAFQGLGATVTASGTSILNHNPPTPARDIAFALRLTWQPPATNTDSMMARSDEILAGESGPGNPLDAASGTGQLAALNAGLNAAASGMDSADTEKTKVPKPDPAPVGSPSPRGNDTRANSSLSLLQSIPVRLLNSDSTGSGSARLRSPATLERIPGVNITASSGPPDLAASGAANNSAEIDVQPPVFSPHPASIPENPTASPLLEADSRETPPPGTETRPEASTPQRPGQQLGQAPEVGTPPRSPLAPTGSIAATHGTSASDAGNKAGRDMSNSGSDPKPPPKAPITEKASQIQTSNQPSGQSGAEVWLDRAAEPGGAMQTETKGTQPLHPPTASPELESSSASQTQPIREISFRLATASASVDVQVAQRAGKIQVAVRTADQDLAKSLQNNLGELVGHLEDKGFRAETWNPIAEQHGYSSVGEPSNSANSQSKSDDSGSRGGQQGQRHGQQESNQRQQGRWRTQLEETLSAPIASTPEEEKLWYPR